jgi:hypothetical protein
LDWNNPELPKGLSAPACVVFAARNVYCHMSRIAVFICFFLIPAIGLSQQTIKGTVVNAESGVVIPGSSVFISNTSRGTTSNNQGHFELTNIPPGKYELIISSIGYETIVFPFSEKDLPLKLKVEMKVKVKELGNVTVEPFLEEGWDKWGRLFTDHFIGTTDNSARCRIKNTEVIKFRFYRKSNRVVAYADEPLLIENRALGYVIRYQLENFEVNFREHSTIYLGYTLFEDRTKEGKEPPARFRQRRDEAFKGSVTHFMQSLYKDQLLQEGYEVRRMVRTPNHEKTRVRAVYRGVRRVSAGTSSVSIQVKTEATSADSTAYYERILRQDDNIDTYGSALLSADSLIVQVEGKNKFLYFDNYLFITYKKEFEEDKYLTAQNLNRKKSFQRSLVTLNDGNVIVIDESGNYFNPQDFFTSGYWGWSEKIANMLPTDYVPSDD